MNPVNNDESIFDIGQGERGKSKIWNLDRESKGVSMTHPCFHIATHDLSTYIHQIEPFITTHTPLVLHHPARGKSDPIFAVFPHPKQFLPLAQRFQAAPWFVVQ